MKLRMKSKKANKDLGTNKFEAVPVLELHLQHGDVVTMSDTRLQAFTEVRSFNKAVCIRRN